MKLISLTSLLCFSSLLVSAQFDPIFLLTNDNQHPLVDDLIEIRLNALNSGAIPAQFDFSLDLCMNPTGLEISGIQAAAGTLVSVDVGSCASGEQSIQVTGSIPGAIAYEDLVIIQYKVLKPGTFSINLNNAAVAGANTTTGLSGSVTALPPFTCQPAFYQVIDSQAKVFDPITQSYTDLGAPAFTQYSTVNAIGYNSVDNYIYGIGKAASNGEYVLLRIGSDGDMAELANLTTLYSADFPASSEAKIAGDMDLVGNLYVINKDATNLCIISNMGSAPSVTSVPISGPDNIASTADIAYNPIDGFLYGTQSGTGANIFKISTTGVQQSIPLSPAIPCPGTTATGFGASWFDSSGAMYTSCNETGNIYQINVTTGSTALVSTSGIPTNNNDGASCALATSPIASPIPTMGQWSLFILALLVSCLGLSFMVNQKDHPIQAHI